MCCPIRFMREPGYDEYGFTWAVNLVGNLTLLSVVSGAFGWVASYAARQANLGFWASKFLVILPASVAVTSGVIALMFVGGVIYQELKG